MLIAVSCSPNKDLEDTQSFEDFDVGEYIRSSNYSDFSFLTILNYLVHINKIDDYSINSFAFSIDGENINSFSISLLDRGENKGVSAIYEDGIFRNRFNESEASSYEFDSHVLLIADTLIHLDDFKRLNISEIYLLGELSSGEVDLSYLSNYDFLLLEEDQLKSIATSELDSLNPSMVFSAYEDENSSPKYILAD